MATSSVSGHLVTSDSGSSSESTSGVFVNVKYGSAFLEGVNLLGLRLCRVNYFFNKNMGDLVCSGHISIQHKKKQSA